MQETKTFVVPDCKWQLFETMLGEGGFNEIPTKSDYEHARYKAANANLIIYKSCKVVVQGKGINAVEDMMKEVGVMKEKNSKGDKKNIDFSSIPRIGSDEVGKGDYFGPMVVAAAYVSPDDEEFLTDLGISDSKGKDDIEIIKICESICGKVMHSVKIVSPTEYNEVYKDIKNAAILLAKAHSLAIDDLIEKVEAEDKDLEMIVIDQFSSSKNRILDELTESTEKYEVEQFHKGESDLAVATASIIARAYFLEEWEKMNDEYRMVFPKGATNVIKTGKEYIKEFGESRLPEVAKVSFKTTAKVLGLAG